MNDFTPVANLISAEVAKSIRERDSALSAWLTANNRNYIDPKVDKHPAIEAAPTNEERAQCELYEFYNKPPTIGEKYGAYCSDSWKAHPAGGRVYTFSKVITSFMGDPLFKVLSTSSEFYCFGRFKARVYFAESLYHPGAIYRGVRNCEADLIILRRVK